MAKIIKAKVSIKRTTSTQEEQTSQESENTSVEEPVSDRHIKTTVSIKKSTPPVDPTAVPAPQDVDTNVVIKVIPNYEKLLNKPSINGVEIVGDKTSNDYNLANADDMATELDKKQDVLIAGNNITIENNVISAAGDKEFIFEQASPAKVWRVNHMLNKFPAINAVEDSAHNVVVCDVAYIDSNNLELYFNCECSGKAYLN